LASFQTQSLSASCWRKRERRSITEQKKDYPVTSPARSAVDGSTIAAISARANNAVTTVANLIDRQKSAMANEGPIACLFDGSIGSESEECRVCGRPPNSDDCRRLATLSAAQSAIEDQDLVASPIIQFSWDSSDRSPRTSSLRLRKRAQFLLALVNFIDAIEDKDHIAAMMINHSIRGTFYSARSAVDGSTIAARRAGRNVVAKPARANKAVTATTVHGSCARTPNRYPSSNREAAQALGMPNAAPVRGRWDGSCR